MEPCAKKDTAVSPHRALSFMEIPPWSLACVSAQALSHVQLFVTPMDCSLPYSSVHGISQARILEWVAISSSRGSSWPRDRRFFTTTPPGKPFGPWQTALINSELAPGQEAGSSPSPKQHHQPGREGTVIHPDHTVLPAEVGCPDWRPESEKQTEMNVMGLLIHLAMPSSVVACSHQGRTKTKRSIFSSGYF